MPEAEALDERAAARASFGGDIVEWTDESIYAWAPVFRAVLHVGGARREVVVKRARRNLDAASAIAEWQRLLAADGLPVVSPVAVGTDADSGHWVAYPYVEGIGWNGALDQIVGSGTLLGRLHTRSWELDLAGLPDFDWPDPDAASAAEDAAGIAGVCALELPPGEADAVAERWRMQLDAFRSHVLPAMRDGDVPWCPATLDYRALNLIFPADRVALPTFVDFEKADRAPRVLDLAVAVILFHCETTPNAGRLFDDREWVAFRDAYLAEAPPLTAEERRLWPTALRFVRLEEGMWHLVESPEWELPGQRAYLLDLLRLDERSRFPLD